MKTIQADAFERCTKTKILDLHLDSLLFDFAE